MAINATSNLFKKFLEIDGSDLSSFTFSEEKLLHSAFSNIDASSLDLLLAVLNAGGCSLSDFYPTEFITLTVLLSDSLDSYFEIELPFSKVRLIHKENIEDIYIESTIELLKKSYGVAYLPSVIAIDWEQSARNCLVDGYGHHFAEYDGKEHHSGSFYIFRIS